MLSQVAWKILYMFFFVISLSYSFYTMWLHIFPFLLTRLRELGI